MGLYDGAHLVAEDGGVLSGADDLDGGGGGLAGDDAEAVVGHPLVPQLLVLAPAVQAPGFGMEQEGRVLGEAAEVGVAV